MNFLKKILLWILCRIPTTCCICYNSYPDYTDNAYAVFSYLQNTKRQKRYKHYWLVNEKENISVIQKKIIKENYRAKVVYKKSVYGIWLFIRCRYCFFTHGIFENLSFHQHEDKLINLWHGMPLKKIGYLDKMGWITNNFDLLISSGIFFRPIMASCFGIENEKVLPIGQPRNDLLFSKTDFFEKKGINQFSYRKIGIWLPTYIKSIDSETARTDSVFLKKIAFLGIHDLVDLNKELAQMGDLLIIKLHPMDFMQNVEFGKYSNIIVLKPKDMDSQLYPLLGACDYLLTDFSSVCIDFDILNRPIAFPMCNLESYKETRGFVFDDLESVLPGPIIFNYKKLLEFMKNPYRLNTSVRLNDFSDSKSSERLINHLGI